jgi:hypothetical protein
MSGRGISASIMAIDGAAWRPDTMAFFDGETGTAAAEQAAAGWLFTR